MALEGNEMNMLYGYGLVLRDMEPGFGLTCITHDEGLLKPHRWMNNRILNNFNVEASTMRSIHRQTLLPRYFNLLTESARVLLDLWSSALL